MTPSKVLFYFCIAFVAGIILQSLAKIPQIFLWGFLILGILTIITSFLFGKNDFMIAGFCILFLVLGIIRFQISEFNIENDKLRKFNDNPEKITLVGQVIDGPDIRDNSQKLKLKIRDSVVLITVGRHLKYSYLDKIKITGKLKTPAATDNFNYKSYLLKDRIYFIMDFPKTELVSDRHDYNIFTFLYEKVLFFREKLRDYINANFTSSQRLILEGIVLGNNKDMTQDLRDKLNGTGLRYLTAISGVHVLILSSILMSFLLFLGFWRSQAFYFAVALIWLYVILTGLPASGIRAAIMGSIFLLAQKLGRQNTSSRVIVLAATIMLLQNPLLLFYDIGFQLSFLASMGIIYLKPIIDILLENIARKTFTMLNNFWQKPKIKIHGILFNRLKNLSDIVSVTLTAQIFTVPIMVYNFGSISLIAPITNILVVPIVYWLMVFGFLTSVSGVFSNFLGWVFSLPCWILLTYFLSVLNIFYQSWAVKTIQNVSWIWFLIYYMILFVLIFYLQRRLKPAF